MVGKANKLNVWKTYINGRNLEGWGKVVFLLLLKNLCPIFLHHHDRRNKIEIFSLVLLQKILSPKKNTHTHTQTHTKEGKFWFLRKAQHAHHRLLLIRVPLYTRSQGQCSTQIKHSCWWKSWNQPQAWAFTLGVKAELGKNLFNLPQVTNKCWTLWHCIGPQGWKKKDTIKFGKPICNPWGQCSNIYWYPDINVLAFFVT